MMCMGSRVAVIIVSHNSQAYLEKCLRSLGEQTLEIATIVVVDSGSDDCSYLQVLAKKFSFLLILEKNIGFSRANNLGLAALSNEIDYVIFVNPDVFLSPQFVSQAVRVCGAEPDYGVVSGKLFTYDLLNDTATTRFDSTGISRTFFGRWIDRGQGEEDSGQYESAEPMKALCGALLFCRKDALNSLEQKGFDEDFFLYKEDIELCLRLWKKGWKCIYEPKLVGYHCRGWQQNRAKIPKFFRTTAAYSELLLYKKHPSPYILWAMLKYFLVKVCNV